MDLTLDEHPQSEEEVQLKRPLLNGSRLIRASGKSGSIPDTEL